MADAVKQVAAMEAVEELSDLTQSSRRLQGKRNSKTDIVHRDWTAWNDQRGLEPGIVASLQKPEWHVIFDMDKAAAIASRKKILGMVAADKVPATGYHMPFPAIGYVEQQGDAFRWIAHSYQLDL